MVKLISTKVHGMLDYGTAALLLLVPRLVGAPADVVSLLMFLGIGIAIYSLITRYELSVTHFLPMPVHLAIDGLGGLVLLGMAYVYRDAGTSTWVLLLVFGLLELGAALLTDPVPRNVASDRPTPSA